MAHVFLSYSSKHRSLTERLRDYLKAKGLTVWYDQDSLEARGPFDGQIRAGLQQAEAVVVIWTTDAIVSEWVNFEAGYADDRRRLINVEPAGIDRSKLPARFREHHRHVQSDFRPLDMEKVLHDILAVREGRPLPGEVPLRQHYEDKYDELLLDTKRLPVDDGASSTPSLLLQAKYGIVPFLDIQGLRPRLIDWTEGRGEGARQRTAAGRLIHGPGGLGKTRLMIEVAAALRERGWSAGFLNHVEVTERQPDKPKLQEEALAQLIEAGDDNGLAIVIDYAEGRTEMVKALSRHMLETGRRRSGRPLVLFLLTREIGEWWDNLRRDDAKGDGQRVATMFSAGLGRTAEIAIAHDASPASRRALFDEARRAFAAALTGSEVAVNPDEPSPALLARLERDNDYARPLAVLMEALLHVYAKSLAGDEIGMAALLDGILDLEIGHWRKVTPGLTDTRELERATAQLTLVGGTGARTETKSLLSEDRAFDRLRTKPLATTMSELARFYGNGRGGLSGLEPDLVGEHMVVGEAAWDLKLAQRLVDACLGWDSGDKPSWKTLLTVLNRATKPEHGNKVELAVALLAHVVKSYAVDLAPLLIDVALAEPQGRLPEVISGVVSTIDVDSLNALDAAMPHVTVRLLNPALALSARRRTLFGNLCALRKQTSHSDEEAHLLASYAAARGAECIRLSHAGFDELALEASCEATSIFRDLGRQRPNIFLPDLAGELINHGNTLFRLHRPDEAVQAFKESIEHYRMLSKDHPEFQPDLALGLFCLGRELMNYSNLLGANIALTESETLFRALAEKNPVVFREKLAATRSAIGTILSRLGRPDEALPAMKETVAIYRDLVATNQDEFVPNLTNALNGLAATLREAGQKVEALTTARESVALSRSLGETNPIAFQPYLARALENSASILVSLNQCTEALAEYNEEIGKCILDKAVFAG